MTLNVSAWSYVTNDALLPKEDCSSQQPYLECAAMLLRSLRCTARETGTNLVTLFLAIWASSFEA